MYYTYSVILNIGHQEQYGGQMQMEQIRDFVLAQEQHGSLIAGEFCHHTHIETSAIKHILPPGGKNQIFIICNTS